MKKTLIIFSVVGIILLGGIFGYKYLKNSKNTEISWKDKYLELLRNISNGEGKKIIFVETKFYDDPLLVLYSDTIDEEKVNFLIEFYALENGTVKNISNYSFGDAHEIKFMYDVKRNKYDYFICSNSELSKTYESLDSLIIDNKVDNAVIDVVSKEGLNAEERNEREKEEYKKYDNYAKYYISKLKEEESTYVIDLGMKIKYSDYQKDDKYLLKKVKELAENYKKNADLGEKYNEKVATKLKNINKENNSDTSKDSSAMAKEFKIGKYTLKYGKYKVCYNGATCDEFTLNEDGTAKFNEKTKYFRIDNYNFAQGVEEYKSGENIYPAIIISDTKNGTGINIYTPYMTSSKCLMTDGDLACVKYLGE